MSGIPQWAVPGAKVVCVRSARPYGWFERVVNIVTPKPNVGETCVFGHRFEGFPGVFRLRGYPFFIGYSWDCFRPLTFVSETDETEATIFRKKHVTSPTREGADA